MTGDVSRLVPRVHFKTATDRVVKGDMEKLEKNAAWAAENRDAVLVLEGHCDERGSEEYNLKLGDMRARAVKAFLVERGVGEDSIAIVSYGEMKPLDAKHTREAWRQNRRVEFVILRLSY